MEGGGESGVGGGERGSGAERKKEEIPGVTLPGGMDPLLLSLKEKRELSPSGEIGVDLRLN